MADIRVYKRMKDEAQGTLTNTKLPADSDLEDDYDEEDYEKKLKVHRIKVAIFCALAVIVAAGVIAYLASSVNNRTYSSYMIMNSVTRDDIQDAGYYAFGEGFVRCSKDGIVYYNKKGTAIWNQTYQMKSPQLKICEGALAVGDINGSTIYMFNEKGVLGSVDTSLSISQIEVGSQGMVAAILEDTTANYINMYDTSGQKVYSVKTTLAGDGYPLDISVSNDSKKLIASYVYVGGESIKTNVVFYNFSDVGQNETERVVGGFNHYDSTLVPEVQFMTDTCAVAVGEDIISIYKIKEFPNLQKEVKLDNTIERVFFSDRYIGVLLDNKESGDNYKLQVYDTSGNKVSETAFNSVYKEMAFDNDTILMSNEGSFALYNIKGKKLAGMESDLPIEKILSGGAKGDYLLVNSTYVQEIRLK